MYVYFPDEKIDPMRLYSVPSLRNPYWDYIHNRPKTQHEINPQSTVFPIKE